MDIGYSLALKHDVFRDNVFADALAFLLSDDVHAEIVGIFVDGDGNTLDVERKHWQDGRDCRGKTIGVSRASRDSYIRRYRLHRRGERDREHSIRAYFTRNTRMNVRALAVAQNHHLQTRGRGQLHWESDISAEQRAAITHQGDEEALQKFIADNYDALNTEAVARRKRARESGIGTSTRCLPATNIGSVGLTQTTRNLPGC